jgi:hypothetical protein
MAMKKMREREIERERERGREKEGGEGGRERALHIITSSFNDRGKWRKTEMER